MAVKVTDVPTIIGLIDAAMETLTGIIGLTVTKTLFVVLQPVVVTVSVKVNVVVTAGVTVGLAAEELNPVGADDQIYSLPATAVAPNGVEIPAQMATSDPACAAGKGFTVMVTAVVATERHTSAPTVDTVVRRYCVVSLSVPGVYPEATSPGIGVQVEPPLIERSHS